MSSCAMVVTGATGFLGSSLGAQILQTTPHSLVCLSRNDSNGARSLASLQSAATGFGCPLSPDQLSRVQVLDSTDPLPACLASFERFAVWHCAADMRYDMAHLEACFETNVGFSAKLFESLGQLPGFERFYHVSTAYTAGFDNLTPAEELHCRPQLINAYQFSKWSAEMSLSTLAKLSGKALTLLRPSIVIGHERTGWHGVSNFGLHGFLSGIRRFARLASAPLCIDIDADARSNYIPINHVVATFLALLRADWAQASAGGNTVDIYHVVGQLCFSNAELAQKISQALGCSIRIAASQNRLDRKLNELVLSNQAFASQTWAFEQRALQQRLAPDFKPFQMTDQTLGVMLAHS
ncbi:SDR family oxidoreductase [Curvibacter sp. RS43]|uniref:SDR family oxidoreductase n=1 Tax=Curvibacter microcysteis TaxID=3026419 RepID=UPI0023609139|nr:SDR family oxidoreductase [Curvibacter sp. RS43]MDD0810205.1 SDR family oxidoreductase [Curvibacter sp. RS43]